MELLLHVIIVLFKEHEFGAALSADSFIFWLSCLNRAMVLLDLSLGAGTVFGNDSNRRALLHLRSASFNWNRLEPDTSLNLQALNLGADFVFLGHSGVLVIIRADGI